MNKLNIQKLETHIPGFDHIACGGLPQGRTTLLTGTSGSGKTVFAAQFLAEGIMKADQGGVFITFEESVPELRKNFLSFSWDISGSRTAGNWVFVVTA